MEKIKLNIITTTAKFKAWGAAERCGDLSLLEDFQQEIIMHLIKNEKQFDDTRSTFKTYCDRIATCKAKRLVDKHFCKKNQMINDAEQITI